MSDLKNLFDNNRAWAEKTRQDDPGFFNRLAQLQAPQYLWIGCSDSRVPANQIVGLMPGEVFVHRNVANLVVHSDLNCLSVLQFAVDQLKVRDVLVVGHYGCGGVRAALDDAHLGLTDNWLRHIQDVRNDHSAVMATCPTDAARHDRLCELNVIEQALNVCHTTIVRQAWASGQAVTVHAWIYGLHDGLMRDLGFSVSAQQEISETYQRALAALRKA
jgi:carbonic anhydrase